MPELTFFRCMTCNGVVNAWDVREGGCQKCGGRRIRPTNLSLWEKLVQLVKHPRVWDWPDDIPTH